MLFIPFIATPFYKFEFSGNRKALKNVPCILASNHISYFDPFIVSWAVGRKMAYMAKKELFETKFGRLFLNFLGAFAVNREKLEVSTIKTAIGIKETGWVLGLFPQGTRETDGNM